MSRKCTEQSLHTACPADALCDDVVVLDMIGIFNRS